MPYIIWSKTLITAASSGTEIDCRGLPDGDCDDAIGVGSDDPPPIGLPDSAVLCWTPGGGVFMSSDLK